MPTSEQKNILVTGAAGQIGTDLTTTLRERFGNQNVVAMGRKTPMPDDIAEGIAVNAANAVNSANASNIEAPDFETVLMNLINSRNQNISGIRFK